MTADPATAPSRPLSAVRDLPVHRRDAEGEAGEAVDFLVDIAAGRISHMIAVLGEAGAQCPALIPTDAVAARDRLLLVDTGQEGAVTPLDTEAAPVDARALPSVLTGPFGNSVAPAMVAATVNDYLSGPASVRYPDMADTGHVWASSMMGQPVFRGTAEIGRLQDLHLAADSFDLAALIVATEHLQSPIPAADLRQMAADGSHLILHDSPV